MNEEGDERKPIPFGRNPDGSSYYLFPINGLPNGYIGDKLDLGLRYSLAFDIPRRNFSFLERFLRYLISGVSINSKVD